MSALAYRDFSHITVRVSDLERALRFYRDGLGLRQLFDVRLDGPGPGIAALGTVSFGGQSMVALNFYLYGDQAAANVAREQPIWQAWFERQFPMPAASESA